MLQDSFFNCYRRPGCYSVSVLFFGKDVHGATRVRLEKDFVVALPEEFANLMTCPHRID